MQDTLFFITAGTVPWLNIFAFFYGLSKLPVRLQPKVFWLIVSPILLVIGYAVYTAANSSGEPFAVLIGALLVAKPGHATMPRDGAWPNTRTQRVIAAYSVFTRIHLADGTCS